MDRCHDIRGLACACGFAFACWEGDEACSVVQAEMSARAKGFSFKKSLLAPRTLNFAAQSSTSP
jgi:hypothetical protein